MSDPKPFASLTPSLLARKGGARPAMRPQGFINFMKSEAPAVEDLGWNDMGHDVEPEVVALPGVQIVETDVDAAPAVVQQQQDLAQQVTPMTSDAQLPRAARGARGKAAFTLRLDPDRHLRLRLLSALSHTSAQQIVTAALDAALELHNVAVDAAQSLARKGKSDEQL